MAQPKDKSIFDVTKPEKRRHTKESWLKLRKNGIGASEAAAACGLSRWKSPLEVWKDKVTEAVNAEDIDVDDHMSEAMYWGNELEGKIRQRARGFLCPDDPHGICNPGRYKIQRHEQYRWMTCTLDGWIKEPTDPIKELFEGFPVAAYEKLKGRGVLEIKTSGQASEWGDNPEDYPLEYMCQVQHSLAVMGYSWGVLACLLAGYGGLKIKYFPFVAVEDFQQALIDKETDFWVNHESKRVAPDVVPTNLAGQIDSLQAQFSVELEGKVLELEEEYDAIDDIRQAAMALRRKADVIEKFGKAVLISRLQDNEMALLNNGSSYTYKSQDRKSYTVKARTDRVLRRSTSKAKIDAARGVLDSGKAHQISQG